MPPNCHRTPHLRHAAGALLVLICLVAALPGPALARRSLPAPPAAKLDHQLYLPAISRPRPPLGMVIQPSELAISKGQFDLQAEPGRSAVKSIFKRANAALGAAPCAVAHYTTAAGYDCLNQSAEYAYLLGIAYRMSGEPAYSEKGAAFITVWLDTLASVDAGDDQAQLDWGRLVPALIWGADLLTSAPGWGEAERARLIGWLKQHALGQAKAAAARANNWADAGNLLWLSVAVYAGLPSEREAAVDSWKLKLDGVPQPGGGWRYGMLPEGSLEEENRRGADGLGYNMQALSMKTMFAEIMQRQGDSALYSYVTPRGVGLKNGWDFLAPRAMDAFAGRCTWPYTPSRCVKAANRSGWELAYARWHAPAYLPVVLEHRPYSWSNWADPGYSTALYGSLNLSLVASPSL